MRYMFIVNPVSGGGKARLLAPRIRENFTAAGADFAMQTTTARGEAVDMASCAVKDGFDAVVAVGGDGTVNEVANGIAGTTALLGAVHGGKGNDFASAVNMPLDVDEACRALLHSNTKAIDLGRVLDRYFVNSAGAGFDAAVAHRVNRGIKPLKGVSAYIFAVLVTLLHYRPVQMEIILDDTSFITEPMLVAVGIGPCYGGGMRIVPDAILDDGFFDICVVERMHPLALLYNFPKVFKGRHTAMKQTRLYRTREVKLILREAQPLHMEGEIFFGREMNFTLTPRGINIITG